jgi:hypothetical protein
MATDNCVYCDHQHPKFVIRDANGDYTVGICSKCVWRTSAISHDKDC